MDDFSLRQFVYNLDVTLNSVIYRLEKALTPKPRGPTPCTAPCRWFAARKFQGFIGFCSARQDSGDGLGASVTEEMAALGCPTFEPLPAAPASVEGPADRDAAGGQ